MSISKKKISISAIIAALSFLFLAFYPYFLNPIHNILLGLSFSVIIRIIINSIFNFGNIVNFIACIITAVGIFTKFDKIAVAITSALFWFSSLFTLISGIINSIKFGYFRMNIVQVISLLSNMFIYFLMFAVAAWLTILFFKKKETPKFLKVLIFVPVAILAISFLSSFITNFFASITHLASGLPLKFFLYSAFSVFSRIFNSFVLLVGLTAIAVKFANFKKKPKNTVEISEDIIVENVTAE